MGEPGAGSKGKSSLVSKKPMRGRGVLEGSALGMRRVGGGIWNGMGLERARGGRSGREGFFDISTLGCGFLDSREDGRLVGKEPAGLLFLSFFSSLFSVFLFGHAEMIPR